MLTISPTQSDIHTALKAFLQAIMAPAMEIVLGQVNRVPSPKGSDYIVFWPIQRERLSTNIDDFVDTVFTGSASGATLTVTAVAFGKIVKGAPLFGVGVADGTTITDFGNGNGGVGTYVISPAQNVGSEKMAAGFNEAMQPTNVTMQIDVHGPSSSDNVQIISTLFRDAYAVDFLSGVNQNITPLFASEPRQVPFANAEQQVETKWTIDLNLEVNTTVVIPQQAAEVVEVDIISVEATYQ